MGLVTYLLIVLVFVLVVAFVAKVAYRRGLNTIPEALKPRFGRAEAMQLKPILDKMGAVSPLMAEYTSKMVTLLGGVNGLAADLAAVIVGLERQIIGARSRITANVAAIEDAKKAIAASEKAIVAAEAAKNVEVDLGKFFGV
ncbi:MAG: hypothetical protein UT43_C0045G0002 [Parcubacteria group bacterium GW2011_GWC1_39_29]|nr:MAG: hypothetical protein UT43_C0045G0002 [Parcubacteria group bacterium GW2011_GWC1_39_29]